MPRPRLTKKEKARRILFSLIVTPEILNGLNAIETRDGLSKSEQVRRAIQQWLRDRQALPVRDKQPGGRLSTATTPQRPRKARKP